MRRTGERAQRILWLQLAATIPLASPRGRRHPPHRETRSASWTQAIGARARASSKGDIRVGGPAEPENLGSRLIGWSGLIELDNRSACSGNVSPRAETPLDALREGSELLVEGTAGRFAGPARNRRNPPAKKACNCSS